LPTASAVSVTLMFFYGPASSDPQAHAGVRHRLRQLKEYSHKASECSA
jgi:hypothetical protein